MKHQRCEPSVVLYIASYYYNLKPKEYSNQVSRDYGMTIGRYPQKLVLTRS